jgi:hypothetical protein
MLMPLLSLRHDLLLLRYAFHGLLIFIFAIADYCFSFSLSIASRHCRHYAISFMPLSPLPAAAPDALPLFSPLFH